MKEREEKAQFWALNAASLLGQLTISMVNLALVYYLRYTLEASAAVVGAAASTYTSVYLICCLALGGFYQRFRPYKVVTVSVLGMALSSFLVTRTSSIILVFSFLILYGFFMSMLWPQVEAWITRGAEGSRLNRLTSAFNFSWSFGTGISPYVTAFLVTYSPSAALAGAVVLFVVIALVFQLLAASCPSVRALVPEREYIRTKEKNEEKSDHSTPLRYDSWIAVFIVYSALSVVLNIFPMYAQEELYLTETTSGFLLLLRGLATCFAFMALGRVRFWQFKAWYIYLCQALFVVLALVFSAGRSVFSIAIFFILFGVLFAQCYSFSIFHSAAGALDRGRRMVIHECVLTVGQVIGASFGGGIYQKMGYSNVLVFLAALASVLLVIQIVVHAVRMHGASK